MTENLVLSLHILNPKREIIWNKIFHRNFEPSVHDYIPKINELDTTNRNNIRRQLYVGCIATTEEFKVYTYITNTKTTFLLLIQQSQIQDTSVSINRMFTLIHSLYSDVVQNPFYTIGSTIES
ncbi:Trafficking protein particle complex subunit 2-like protein, partial [Intoshia linei]